MGTKQILSSQNAVIDTRDLKFSSPATTESQQPLLSLLLFHVATLTCTTERRQEKATHKKALWLKRLLTG